MKTFELGKFYRLTEILSSLGKHIDWEPDPSWVTDYFAISDKLILFLDLEKRSFEELFRCNHYDPIKEQIGVVLKPGSHSAQPALKALIDGKSTFEVFAKWGGSSRKFLYFGRPTIISYHDNVLTSPTDFSAMFLVNISQPEWENNEFKNVQLVDGNVDGKLEGRALEVKLNKFERDPYLRSACIQLFGSDCSICSFNFEDKYGILGRGYCQIHHIVPLSEIREEHYVNPYTDLIPVCPNCHAMLHRSHPALSPSALRQFTDSI